MKAIITLDIGTTSMRGILYDADGNAVHAEQRENIPSYFNDGRVEQDPHKSEALLPDILKACEEAAELKGLEPLCVSVTAQRSSVIPVDSSGAPLFPAIMWQDRRTADLAKDLEVHNLLVYRRTGLNISPVFSALKMLWLKKNRPDILEKTHKLIGIQDWILFLLTGRFVTDMTFGSRTNLLDLERKTWDPEMLSLFQVNPERLCDLVEPGSVVGLLTSSMAGLTGLKSGLPVVSAGGDQQCAALGLGLFSGERAVSNTGTGSYLIGHADRPVFDELLRVSCNLSAVPGSYIVEAAMLTTGTIYRWFGDIFSETGNIQGISFKQLDQEAGKSPPGSNGLMLLPHFKGSGSPHWDPQAKGVFYNLTLSSTRGDMARSILEAIALEMKENLELVENLCGPVGSVSVSGGMARSDLFNQIQSDVFGRRVVRFPSHEASSLGAWIAGSVAMGLDASYAEAFTRISDEKNAVVYQSDPSNRGIYELQHRRYRALYQALGSVELRDLFN